MAVLRVFAAPETVTDGIVWPVSTDVSQMLDGSEQFQAALDATLAEAADLPQDVARAAICYCVRRQAERFRRMVELLTLLLDAEDRTLRVEAAMAIAHLIRSGRSNAKLMKWAADRERELQPLLTQRLLEALVETPDGVEYLEVATALRQILDRRSAASLDDANSQLMTLLEMEHERDRPELFQLKLASRPAGLSLQLQSYVSWNIRQDDEVLANLPVEVHTLSRRTILTGLLLHTWRIGIPAERDVINARIQKLAESLARQPGGSEVKPIAPDAENIGPKDFLWPRDSSLKKLDEYLYLLASGPHPGVRLRTTPGGDAEAEQKAFRNLLGCLLGRPQ